MKKAKAEEKDVKTPSRFSTILRPRAKASWLIAAKRGKPRQRGYRLKSRKAS